ncbi:MAG TPA: N-acetylmuramidase domain-containing protein [Longimicrobium sp.]
MSTLLAGSGGVLEAADAWVTGGRGRISGALLEAVLGPAGPGEDLDRAAPPPTPAALFDAFAGGHDPAARRALEATFELVAGPGEPVDPGELRPGDLVVRAAPGEGAAHLAVVGPRGAVPGEALADEGLTPETRGGGGLYVHVVEGGAFAHASGDGYARRVAGPEGRMDRDTVVLRLRGAGAGAEAWAAVEDDGRDTEDDSAAEDEPFPPERLGWPGSTAEQLAFMREVYRRHVANSSARRRFVADVPGVELGTIEGGHRARSAAAADCRGLLAECRAELQRRNDAGDARARRVSAIGVVSAYRSASQQLAAWQGNFPMYYNRTASERAGKPGGEHGAEAAAYLARYIGGWLGAPGFSLHNDGRAIDFTTTEGGTAMGASSGAANRAAWRRSWMWEWMTTNAARFHFFQNTAIDEPWHWEHRPPATMGTGAATAALAASTAAAMAAGAVAGAAAAATAAGATPGGESAWSGAEDDESAPAECGLEAVAEDEESIPSTGLAWDGATGEQLAFMRAVYDRHVAASASRRTFIGDVPRSERAEVEGDVTLRAAAATDLRALFADCRAERARQAAAGDARAAAVSRVGIASGYRSASRQFGLWQKYFPRYYARTREHRLTLEGGEHGDAAVRYTARYVGQWIAAPGFSLHNDGRAGDLFCVEGGVRHPREGAAGREALRASWFFGWMTAHAARFNFHQNTAIDEPWHWEHRPPAGGGEPAREAEEDDEAAVAALEAAEVAWSEDDEACGCPPGTHGEGAHEAWAAAEGAGSLLEPAPVADERWDADPAENALPWPPFTVLDPDARTRGGPPGFAPTGGRIPQWTRAYQTGLQGGYVQLADANRADLGWTKRVNVGMYFKDIPHLTTTALAPATPITPDPGWPALRRALCDVCNHVGGLLGAVAAETGTPAAAALAVWYVESAGRAHTPGAAIIRFENHLFWDGWGSAHAADYDAHFQHGGRAGVSGKRWENHRWREGVSGAFGTFHGRQDREYRVLNFAAGLAGFDTAAQCISIGGPQILVSNYRMIGYATPTDMYNAFQGQDERWQVLGFFDFCQFKFGHGARRGDLLRDLRARDWRAFARGYNGSGQVDDYSTRLRNAYDQAMILLGSPADPPEPATGAWFLPQPSESVGEDAPPAPAVSVGAGIGAAAGAVRGAAARAAIAAGRSEVATLPLLAPHGGAAPDLVVRWNDMTAPPPAVDVVVHLHGYDAHATRMTLPRDMEPICGLDWSNPDDRADPTPGRRLPTVGLLPRGRYFGGKYKNAFDFPELVTATGMRDLVAAGLAEFARATGAAVPAVRRLIYTAHSGGGAALMRVLRHNDPHEVFAYDALYGPAGALIDWARRHIAADAAAVAGQPQAAAEAYMRERGGGLRVQFIPNTDTQLNSLIAHRALVHALRAATFAPFDLPAWYRVEATGVGHTRMPRRYGWRLLADVSAPLPHARVPRAAAPAAP